MMKYAQMLAGLLLLTTGCKPDDPDPVPVGGKGGSGVLNVTPRHHSKPIDSCTVYIKYNATDPPLDGKYDDSVRCVQQGGLPVATFNGLKKGNYYLYGYGWDPGLTPPQAVKGGFAYPLGSESVQSIDLAVSEGD